MIFMFLRWMTEPTLPYSIHEANFKLLRILNVLSYLLANMNYLLVTRTPGPDVRKGTLNTN